MRRKPSCDVLPQVRNEAESADKERKSGPVDATSAQATRTDRSKSSVFNDIAVAHGEIYALYQIAQTMGTSLGVSDTMALIASKLTSLVPFSACTLFLYDESAESSDLPVRNRHRLRADAAARR